MLRVERLSRCAQELLRLARRRPAARPRVLAEVGGLDSRALRDALREAVASHIVVAATTAATRSATRCCARSSTTTCCPASAPSCTLRSPRALRSASRSATAAPITAAIAHHYAAAGDQPAALAAAVRAAAAAERVTRTARRRRCYERALELWDRVDDPEPLAGRDRVELLRRAADGGRPGRRPGPPGGTPRGALGLVDDSGASRTVRPSCTRSANALWHLNRTGRDLSRCSSGRSRCSRGTSRAPKRASLLGSMAKKRMLQARFGAAERYAREALTVARPLGNREAEARALNALGVAMSGQGDLRGRHRVAARVARDRARARPVGCEEGSALPRISRTCSRWPGRTEEGLAVVRDGMTTGLPGEQPTARQAGSSCDDRRVQLLPGRVGRGRATRAAGELAAMTDHTLAYWYTVAQHARVRPRRPRHPPRRALDGPRTRAAWLDRAPVRRPAWDFAAELAVGAATSRSHARRSTRRSTRSSTARTTSFAHHGAVRRRTARRGRRRHRSPAIAATSRPLSSCSRARAPCSSAPGSRPSPGGL